MARLTQQSSATSQKPAVSLPQSAQTVPQKVATVVTPIVKRAPRRRLPRWFFPVLSLALVLTVVQLGHLVATDGLTFARSQGWRPSVKHTIAVAMPSRGWYAISPQGDKYLAGYQKSSGALLELHKSSGELLWQQNQMHGSPVFSQDGTEIFSGPEVLETATGKRIARAPIPKTVYDVFWAPQGSVAAWKYGNDVQVWDRDTNKTRTLALKGGYRVSNTLHVSPDGKWLATSVDDQINNNVALWNLTKSAEPELHSITIPINGSFGLAFSPDSRQLLYTGQESTASSRGQAFLWSLDSSKPTYEFAPRHYATTAVWSPDGKNFAVRGGKNEWSVYKAASGELLWSNTYRTNHHMLQLYFTQDNKLYFYDYAHGGWSFEYWDLAKVLSERKGN